MKSIYDYSIESFASYFLSIGEKKYRATQMMEALYRNKVKSFEEITNINKKTIEVLKESFSFDNGLNAINKGQIIAVFIPIFALCFFMLEHSAV